MASEIAWRHNYTGSTLYFTIRGGAGTNIRKMWNTSGTPAFETLTVANWANYEISMTESPSSSYFYAGTFPAISGNMVAGWYWVDIYAGTAGISDTLVASLLGYWDGTYFKPQADDTIAVGGTVQTAAGIANLGVIVPAPVHITGCTGGGTAGNGVYRPFNLASNGTWALTNGTLALWWDGSSAWNISAAVGTTGSNYYSAASYANGSPAGLTFTAHGTYTGSPVSSEVVVNAEQLTGTAQTAVDIGGQMTGDTGVTLQKLLEMAAAWLNGKVVSTDNGDGTYTYSWKKRDGTTESFTSVCSTTDGTRATTGSLT